MNLCVDIYDLCVNILGKENGNTTDEILEETCLHCSTRSFMHGLFVNRKFCWVQEVLFDILVWAILVVYN